MAIQLKLAGLPDPVREHRFCMRKFRFDFAWPDKKLAVEIHGGIWNGGRHVSGVGFANDCVKRNYAVMGGWRVLEFVGSDVKDGSALTWIRAFLARGQAGTL
jgi:very-short-patch-repair endonuclease